MQANELRIGNLVLDEDGDEMPIGSLDARRTIVFHSEAVWSEIDTLRGIPLTEEWLERLGFERHMTTIWHLETNLCYYVDKEKRFYQFTIYWNEEQGFYHSEQSPTENMAFVHQLQNLYFALTGQELE